MIPYTQSASINAELRYGSSRPPFKQTDCKIFESVLEYINSMKQNYEMVFFYTSDKEDFDNLTVRTELKNLDVKLFFEPGEIINKICEFNI